MTHVYCHRHIPQFYESCNFICLFTFAAVFSSWSSPPARPEEVCSPTGAADDGLSLLSCGGRAPLRWLPRGAARCTVFSGCEDVQPSLPSFPSCAMVYASFNESANCLHYYQVPPMRCMRKICVPLELCVLRSPGA